MTDTEMYELLCAKAHNIKMHMQPEDVAEIAKRFKTLSEKQTPKKPNAKDFAIAFSCPNCDEFINGYPWDYKYCRLCGQKLDWSGT